MIGGLGRLADEAKDLTKAQRVGRIFDCLTLDGFAPEFPLAMGKVAVDAESAVTGREVRAELRLFLIAVLRYRDAGGHRHA